MARTKPSKVKKVKVKEKKEAPRVKPKICEMSQDQKQSYFRDKQRAWRDSQRISQTVPSTTAPLEVQGRKREQMNAITLVFKHSASQSSPKNMSSEELKNYNRQKQTICRSKKKMLLEISSTKDDNSDESEVPEALTESCTNVLPKNNFSKKRIVDMTDDEKREYWRQKKRACRQEQKLIQKKQQDGCCEELVVDVTENSGTEETVDKPGSRKRSSEAPISDVMPKSIKQDTDEMHRNVDCSDFTDSGFLALLPQNQHNHLTVRFSLVNLLHVETEAIVVPHYGDVDYSKKSVYNQYLKKLANDEDEKIQYKAFLESTVLEENIPSTYTNENKVQFHLRAPVSDGKNFNVVIENSLRASYLSCLHTANVGRYRSIGIPIIGKGVDRRRSIAIAIQTIFAYSKLVEVLNLNLVYLITKNLDEYDNIGRFLSYVREIDVHLWSQEEYLIFETFLYNQFETTRWYSSLPGTDMVLRSLSCGYTNRKKKLEHDAACKIHKTMFDETDLQFCRFQFYNEADGNGPVMPKQHISGVDSNNDIPSYLTSFIHPLENLCGSNTVLRKIWIVSFYVMFFKHKNGGNIDLRDNSEEFEQRKLVFHTFKHLHKEVLKAWRRTVKYLPYKCNCLKTRGYHENFMMFTTPMSSPDETFKCFLLNGKTLLIEERSLLKMDSLRYELVPELKNSSGSVRKVIITRSIERVKNSIGSEYSEWFLHRERYFKEQNVRHEQLLIALDIQNENSQTGIESNSEMFRDVEEYDQLMSSGYFCEDFREQQQLAEAEYILSMACGDEELNEATEQVKKSLTVLSSKRFAVHVINEEKLELAIHNRFFRLNLLHADLWTTEDSKIRCVDQYIEAFMKKNSIPVGLLQDPIDDGEDNEIEIESHPLIDEYPNTVDLGCQNDKCPYCGALSFPSERLRSCCKNGAIWISPIKLLPQGIDQLFQNKFRKWQIATNAAFSMASISYRRQQQASHGINSMKINGVVSFHPSSLHSNDPNRPRYSNFIVLGTGNESIAAERFELLKGGNSQLKPVFEFIQKYLDENNCLYSCYKSMADIEEEFLKDSDEPDISSDCLKFRIVSPTELAEKDVKALAEHQGVYARPSRMGSGYITVAYTFNAEDSVPIPRGLTIYPRNPSTTPQMPLSVFSDLCDQLCYPLFHPEGTGGWALHKFQRWTEKGPRPSYEMRKEEHIRELLLNGEDPDKYYLNSKTTDDVADSNEDGTPERLGNTERASKRAAAEYVDPSEEDCWDEEDEDDPLNLSNDQILDYGKLEDGQEVPESDEVGQEPNIIMVERGGDMYPVVDKTRKNVDIPWISGNPFGEDKDEEQETSKRISFNDGANTYDDLIERDHHEEEVEIGEKAGEDVDKAPETTTRSTIYNPLEESSLDENDAVLDENICFGDEYDTEPLAMAQSNDGIKVKNVGQRANVSMAEYCNFQLQQRQEIPCRYQGKAGPLGQLATIDWACRIREARMAALTARRAEFARSASRNKVFQFKARMVQKQLKGLKKLGLLVTLPSTTPGTSKYQRELVMSAVTISNKLGSPHLFITFTGNPKWSEIQNECKKQKCQWSDIPVFVNSVFKTKFDLFMDDVVGKKSKSSAHNGRIVRGPGVFGDVKWFTYSVEFQQRGMPHVHLLLSLEKPITNAEQVNKIISAEVPDFPTDSLAPDYEDKLRYYDYVKGLMTHFPCKDDDLAYCKEGKKHHWTRCCKGFPHEKQQDTIMCDNCYPQYKRNSNNVFTLVRSGKFYQAGDEYVVPHNPYLLLKYKCHINVEVVSTIRTMKYMFKYIFKGADRVLLEASENLNNRGASPDTMTLQGNVFAPSNLNPAKLHQRKQEATKMMRSAGINVQNDEYVALNETSYMMDLSAMTACEAAWRIAANPMHGCSHIVHRGYIHEEGNDLFYVRRGVSTADAEEMLNTKSKSMMEAWFEANRNPQKLPGRKDETTNDLTLTEMFPYYKFDVKNQKFILRKYNYSDRIMGRIQAPQPRWLELTATRILSQHVRGPRSWEDLRTFNNVVYGTCLEAARARRLMNGESEWDDAIAEVTQTESDVQCRRFFASILIHSAPVNPSQLWENHWMKLVDNKKFWSDDQKKAHALRHIKFLLRNHGMQLSDFELDQYYDSDNLPCIDATDDHDNPEAVVLDRSQHLAIADQMNSKLNAAQKLAVDRALGMDRESGKSRMMFVEGPGGTGKTFVYTTIYHYLKHRGRSVICIAHTGQAASLLPYGCTAHRKCSIPLEVSDTMTCKVAPFTDEGDVLSSVDAIIWDEICMTDRRIVTSVSNLFKDLKDIDLPFGGTLVIMGGDWRQILPIVEGIRGPGVTDYILKKDDIWSEIEKFHLTENQRAISDPDFAELILSIGDGRNYANTERQLISLPEEFVERGDEKDLIEWVFPDMSDIAATKSAALLTMDNKTSLRLNEVVLDKLNGEEHVFLSTDIVDKDNGLSADPEVFARETPSGMPPHKLRLKLGAQVTLLRNLSVEHGLCNGTRLTIEEFGQDIIYCSVNNPTSNSPKKVFLHRIRMSPTGKGSNSCGFIRLQYPIRLSYACTVNKSQGMTLSKCGLVLHSNVFSHGQLYVAMSRVRKSQDFRLWHYRRNSFDDFHFLGGILVRNVVFKDALLEAK